MLVSGRFVAKMAAQASVRSGLALSAPLMQTKSDVLRKISGLVPRKAARVVSGGSQDEEGGGDDLWQAWASDRVEGIDGKVDDKEESN